MQMGAKPVTGWLSAGASVRNLHCNVVSAAGQAAPLSTPQGPPLAIGRNALMFSPRGCFLLPIWVKSTGVPASIPCPSCRAPS